MSDRYDALKLENQLCFPLYLCAKEIVGRYTPVLKELNLTYTQYIVMLYFWERGESNLKDLGRALLLDSGTLTPLLKKLEQKGYLTRRRSKSDERNLNLRLTEKGEALKERALSVPERIGRCIDLSDRDAQTLYRLAYRLLSGLIKREGDAAAV